MVEGHVFQPQEQAVNSDTLSNRVAHIANHEIYHAMGNLACNKDTCRQRQGKATEIDKISPRSLLSKF
jgi:predicted Zn-dependent protease